MGASFRTTIAAAVAGLVVLAPSFGAGGGSYVQQGAALTAGDETPSAGEFAGESPTGGDFTGGLALSADGSTALVAGPVGPSGRGVAWVYVRSGGAWVEQQKLTVAGNTASTGSSSDVVALSADGHTAVVSASDAVTIFTRAGGSWSEEQEITPDSGSTPVIAFAAAVALSADGSTLLVGGSAGGSAAVSIYERSGPTWTEAQQLVGVGGDLAISADGGVVMVGERGANGGAGAVAVYTRSGGVWSAAQQIPAPAGVPGGNGGFGGLVALSADGTSALIGALDAGSGAVWYYTEVGGVWTQQDEVPRPADAAKEFGAGIVMAGNDGALIAGTTVIPGSQSGEFTLWAYSLSGTSWSQTQEIRPPTGTGISSPLAISADGTTALVGQCCGVLDGLWVFASTASGWAQTDTLETPPDVPASSLVGSAVAVASDGSTAILGGPDDGGVGLGSQVGAAWVFARSGTGWGEEQKIVPPGGSGRAGRSVALSGDGGTALVAACCDVNTPNGAVWVYTRSGSAWTEQQEITLPANAPGTTDGFGDTTALADDGDTLLVGAPGTLANPSVWVYADIGGTWVEQQRLTPPSGTLAGFGTSLALSADGDTALIGAGEGVAVYTRAGSTWTEQQSLAVPADAVGAAPDFGAAVALSASGDVALVGAPADDSGLGAAWVYTESGGTWGEQQKIAGPADGSGAIAFGTAVALSGDASTAVIGGYKDGALAGSAWVYTDSGSTWSELEKLVPGDESGDGRFGSALALSSDGTTAVVGAPDDEAPIGLGAAWVFSAATPQAITFTSAPPANPVFGGTYVPSAFGGGSGNPVVFSIDGSSTPRACSIEGATVSFTGTGSCVIDANQAGGGGYLAASQAQQAITIAKAPQEIELTSSPPAHPAFTGSYPVSATGGASGNPVTFSIDGASSPGACALDGATVTFTGIGVCVVDADQAGNDDYAPAPQVQQTITIAPTTLPSDGLCDNLAVNGAVTGDVVVPAGTACLLAPGTTVSGDLSVESGASFIDQGAAIHGDLTADDPSSIEIGGQKPSLVGHDLRIDGLTGPQSGDDDYICNAEIGHDLVVEDSAATAGGLVIGGLPDCDGPTPGETVGHNLQVNGGADPVDIAATSVGHDLEVVDDSGGAVVDGNTAGHDATCQGDTPPPTVADNTAGQSDDGCPP